MLFHTWPFLIFMLIVLPGYFALRKTPMWIPWLLAASYFFYAWWNPYYLLLVVYSTALDYLLVTLMDHCPPAGDHVLGGKWWRLKSPPRPNAPAQDLAGDSAGAIAVNDPARKGGSDSVGSAPRTAIPDVEATVRSADPTAQGHLSPSHPPAYRTDRLLQVSFIISTLVTLVLIAGAIFAPEKYRLRPTFIAFATIVGLMAFGARAASRRVWLFISLFNNLALLVFFKYARFAEQNLNQALTALGVDWHFPDPSKLMPHGWEYVLPVGISFFTFQSMSYTIDFYFGKVQRERNILRFATFVCFFPQLMAGPIERARQMLPQLQKAPPFAVENITDGMSLFLVGLFKKLALANYLGLYVDRIYENPANATATSLVFATVGFAWQIFFDFSGYTDMARGVAKMMGFNLVLNFNNPYLATGLADFWSRWHISLSTWFRDYVYIPLGGNRRGMLATYRNLCITFVVSGIWHGANWTFAIWGALHAVGIMLTRELERGAFYRDRVPVFVKRAWVFVYVCFAWIFFRASSLSDAVLVVTRIFTAVWYSVQMPAVLLALILSVWLYQMIYESRWRELLRFSPVRVALAAGMILFIGICSTGGKAFIYFQF